MHRLHKTKECGMPDSDGALKVLVLNASLKHQGKGASSTEELAQLVFKNLDKYGGGLSQKLYVLPTKIFQLVLDLEKATTINGLK